MKQVLIMCTGNSCRSIIAEALANKEIDGIQAYSCGVNPSGKVNPNAKKILQTHGIWKNEYHSKHLDELVNIEFDLVATVCDHAKETCPTFPKQTKRIHAGFEDPEGKSYDAFENTYQEIKTILIPAIKKAIS